MLPRVGPAVGTRARQVGTTRLQSSPENKPGGDAGPVPPPEPGQGARVPASSPLVTTYFGPRTAATGFAGTTWLTTSQSHPHRPRHRRTTAAGEVDGTAAIPLSSPGSLRTFTAAARRHRCAGPRGAAPSGTPETPAAALLVRRRKVDSRPGRRPERRAAPRSRVQDRGRAARPRAADAPRRLPRPHPLCSARATNAAVPDRAGDARPSRTTRPLPRPAGFVLLRRTVTSTPSLSAASRRLSAQRRALPRRSGASPHGGEPTALEGGDPWVAALDAVAAPARTSGSVLWSLRCGATISPVFPGAFRRMRLVIPADLRLEVSSTQPTLLVASPDGATVPPSHRHVVDV